MVDICFILALVGADFTPPWVCTCLVLGMAFLARKYSKYFYVVKDLAKNLAKHTNL